MPQIPDPDTYRVVARLTRGDEQIVNVYHCQAPAHTPVEQQAVLDAFQTFYSNLTNAAAPNRGIRDLLSNDVLIDTISVQDIGAVPYDDPVERAIGTQGTAAADSLPLQTTINIQWRSLVASRNARGRTALGGFTTAALDEGSSAGAPIVVPTYLTGISNAVTDLFTALNLNNTDLVVASFYEGKDPETGKPLPRAEGINFLVKSAKVANKFGTQRRRANRQNATSSVVVINP